MARICCSPPESWPAGRLRRCPRMGKRSISSAISRCTTWPSRRTQAPSSRFSRTVRRARISRPSGTCTSPPRTIRSGEAVVRSRRSKRAVPALGRSNPDSVLRMVDLPAPLAPIRATISPLATPKETLRTA